jgi:hypothetical protein
MCSAWGLELARHRRGRNAPVRGTPNNEIGTPGQGAREWSDGPGVCLLVLFVGFVCWFCLLVLFVGFVCWFCLLVLFVGFVCWFCL